MGTKLTQFFCISLLFTIVMGEMRHFPDRSQMFSKERYYKPSQFLRHLEDDSVNSQIKSDNVNNTDPVTMRLKGNTELGYYYVSLFFGVPLQKQTLIVDTGSTTTTIPCEECGDKCGQHHFDKPFNHDQSETFQEFKCLEKFGEYVCGDCTTQPCSFSVSYVEGSSYRGHFTRDYVSFGNEIEDYFSLLLNKEPEQVDKDVDENKRRAQQEILQGIVNQRKTFTPFGCTDKETKLFYDQEADGILGLGVNTNTRGSPPNLLDAMTLKNSEFDRSFSLCLAQDGGYFTVGGHNTAYHSTEEKIAYTRYYEEYGQYRVYLKKIEVEGQDIGLKPATLNHGEGAFFDSGTTLTHMPSETYNSIRSHITSFCANDEDNCGGNFNSEKQPFCWTRHTKNYPTKKEFFDSFPTFNFYFGQDGDAKYEWKAEDYLFSEKGEEKYCLGLARYDRETILGGTFMKNHDVLFDKDSKKLGFVRANCAAVNEVSSLTGAKTEEPKVEPSKPTDNTPDTKEPANNTPDTKEPVNNTPDTKEPTKNTPDNKEPTEVDPSTNTPNKPTDTTTLVSNQDNQWSEVKKGIVVVSIVLLVGGLIYAFLKSSKNKNYFKDIQHDVELQSAKALGTSFEASLPETPNAQKHGATHTVESANSGNSEIGMAI